LVKEHCKYTYKPSIQSHVTRIRPFSAIKGVVGDHHDPIGIQPHVGDAVALEQTSVVEGLLVVGVHMDDGVAVHGGERYASS
jgi:hypothetical protein